MNTRKYLSEICRIRKKGLTNTKSWLLVATANGGAFVTLGFSGVLPE